MAGNILYAKDDYERIESMSGANTMVILEFPAFEGGMYTEPVYIKLNSAITLAWSVHRATISVTPIGSYLVTGFGLGNKTVAGHLIKTLTYTDELSNIVKYYSKISLQHKNKNFTENLGSKFDIDLDSTYEISQKTFESAMKDDLIPFNIHAYSISEYTGRMIKDTIYGCTIINTGQVQSIENLITENTVAFVAQSVEQGIDVVNLKESTPTLNSVMSLSKLLQERKR